MLPAQNNFTFPWGLNPGVDLGHPALTTNTSVGTPALIFSGIAIPGASSFRRLDRAETGVVTSTVTASMDGFIGPVVTFGSNGQVLFSAVPATAPSNKSFAAIIRMVSATSKTIIGTGTSNPTNDNMTVSGSGTNVHITMNNSNLVQLSSGLAVGECYFMAGGISNISGTSKPGYMAAMNLRTGIIADNSGTLNTTPQITTNILVGNVEGGGQGWTGSLAACAMLNTYVDSPIFRQWALNPWGFWFPPSLNRIMTSSLASPAASNTLRNRMSTGMGL